MGGWDHEKCAHFNLSTPVERQQVLSNSLRATFHRIWPRAGLQWCEDLAYTIVNRELNLKLKLKLKLKLEPKLRLKIIKKKEEKTTPPSRRCGDGASVPF